VGARTFADVCMEKILLHDFSHLGCLAEVVVILAFIMLFGKKTKHTKAHT
jgi:hypothetical protein